MSPSSEAPAAPEVERAPTSKRARFDSSHEISTRAAANILGAPSGVQAIVLTGSHKGTSKVVGGRLTIGKAPDNDLVLTDDTVSRHHCELIRAPDGLHVRDLESTNGTRVDNTRIREAMVQPGSVLKVGEVDIQFKPPVARVEVLPSDKHSSAPPSAQSLAMRTIFGVLERIAPTDATVLLEGETGTGKDVLARAIWCGEPARASRPFVVVDCGAVTLLAHRERAVRPRARRVHRRRRGAPGRVRARRRRHRLPRRDRRAPARRAAQAPARPRDARSSGASAATRRSQTNVRVIAATKRDLHREVAGGKFREDLYFRLAVVPVTVPPLRARREDIPALVKHMLKAAGGTRHDRSRPRRCRRSPRTTGRATCASSATCSSARSTWRRRPGVEGDRRRLAARPARAPSDARVPLRAREELPRDAREVRRASSRGATSSGCSAGTRATSAPPRARPRWTASTCTTWRRSTASAAPTATRPDVRRSRSAHETRGSAAIERTPVRDRLAPSIAWAPAILEDSARDGQSRNREILPVSRADAPRSRRAECCSTSRASPGRTATAISAPRRTRSPMSSRAAASAGGRCCPSAPRATATRPTARCRRSRGTRCSSTLDALGVADSTARTLPADARRLRGGVRVPRAAPRGARFQAEAVAARARARRRSARTATRAPPGSTTSRSSRRSSARTAASPWTAWERAAPRPRPGGARPRAQGRTPKEIDSRSSCSGSSTSSGARSAHACTERGVGLIGDLPIFVAHDSADVWQHPEVWKLDDEGAADVGGRRSARLLQRDRPALGQPALPLGAPEEGRLRAGGSSASAPRSRGSTRCASITSSASPLLGGPRPTTDRRERPLDEGPRHGPLRDIDAPSHSQADGDGRADCPSSPRTSAR